MVLNLPDMENIFPHSKEFSQGGGNIRPGQATIVVALDGSGDTSDIQEGINLLPKAGGVVYIKEGTYIIEGAVSPLIKINNPNISLIGTGKGTKIQTTSDTNMIWINGEDNCLIENIYFYGAGTGNTDNIGISSINSNASAIRGCWIENCEDGIVTSGTNDAVTIHGNFIENNFGDGMVIVGNYTIVSDNQISGNDDCGIYVDAANKCVIEGNISKSNGQDGIKINTGSDNVIVGNVCESNGWDGIKLDSSANDNIISSNRCDANTDGIDIVNANCNRNVIIGNICLDNTSDEVEDAGTNTTIINKQIDILHDSITAGTIASHDTSATGTELDTLTDASDASTLHTHTLNTITNPDASKTFNLGNEKFLSFTSVDRTPVAGEGIFNFETSGNFTGDLVHIHQHTGNAGVGTILLHLEGEDADITPFRISDGVPNTIFNVDLSGNLTLAGLVDGVDIAARDHDAVTITDTSTINLTLAGQDIKGDVIAGSIDSTHIGTSFGVTATNLHNFIPATFTNRSYAANAQSSADQAASIFSGDINAGGTGGLTTTNVPYDNDSNEGMLSPNGTVDGRIVLHNTTRGNSRKVTAIDTANNAITTEASTDDWADNDALTAESQVVTGGAVRFIDLDLSNQIPATAVAVCLEFGVVDSGGGGTLRCQPYEAYGSGKIQQVRSEVAGGNCYRAVITKVASQKIAIGWSASGAGTLVLNIRCVGWWENADT